jgi:hypothetical protein
VQTAQTTDRPETKPAQTPLTQLTHDRLQVAIKQVLKFPGDDERRDDKKDVVD